MSNGWHYYISSRKLIAKKLLRRARLEWSVETMYRTVGTRLLDVHFHEDFCRVEDRHVQQNLNMIRKIALDSIRGYKKNSFKKPYFKNYAWLLN